LSLFAAGVALLALLFASYSRRSTWIALGSTTLSMAALIGCFFLSTIQDPGQVRTRIAWVGSQLPPVLDRQLSDDLTKAVEYLSKPSSCDASQRPECRATASAESPPAGREAMQADSTTSWLGTKQDAEPTKPESKAASQYPVTWRLDEPHVPGSSSAAQGFLIGGTNVSDKALEEVHAVLKPDSSQRESALALDVEGHKFEAGTVIPAGARFSLVSATPNGDGSKQSGGAILRFDTCRPGNAKPRSCISPRQWSRALPIVGSSRSSSSKFGSELLP
jgi:hypothetical protein